MREYEKLPFLVVSDGEGNIFEIPEYRMAGRSVEDFHVPSHEELIPIPHGSDLFRLPGRKPVGYDPRRDKFVELAHYQGQPVWAVAAFMAPAHIQIYRAAYVTEANAPPLPLYSYTAVGWKEGDFFVAGKRVDPDVRQNPENFHLGIIEHSAQEKLKQYSGNRLVEHLVNNCVLEYGCPAARNFVLGRWDCPVPVSPGCNASCIGCISQQPPERGITPPQERISFRPTVEEIVEMAVPHLQKAPRALISFGQGCEGEPLLQGELLEAAIRAIRRITPGGIINLNTNASRPELLEILCRAGLDSVRVSMNSAQKTFYEAYYKTRNYRFEDVLKSIQVVKSLGKWCSINYFIFPGLTDHPSEMFALERLLKQAPVDMIQTRNLNIDPEWYEQELGLADLDEPPVGMLRWLERLRQSAPGIKIGYFNPPAEEMVS